MRNLGGLKAERTDLYPMLAHIAVNAEIVRRAIPVWLALLFATECAEPGFRFSVTAFFPAKNSEWRLLSDRPSRRGPQKSSYAIYTRQRARESDAARLSVFITVNQYNQRHQRYEVPITRDHPTRPGVAMDHRITRSTTLLSSITSICLGHFAQLDKKTGRRDVIPRSETTPALAVPASSSFLDVAGAGSATGN